MSHTNNDLKKTSVFGRYIHVLFIVLMTVLLTVTQTGIRIYAEETGSDDPADEVTEVPQETEQPGEEFPQETAGTEETEEPEEVTVEEEPEETGSPEEEYEETSGTAIITLMDEEDFEEEEIPEEMEEETTEETEEETSEEPEETEDEGRFIDGDFGPIDTEHAPYMPEYGTYPDATGEADFICLEDMYGRVDQSEAAAITSLFSDDAFRQLEEGIERILSFEPAGNEEVSSVLTKTRAFVKAGGLKADQSALKAGNLGASASAIGLLSAAEEQEIIDNSVKILGSGTNSSSWIYVVDADTVCITVTDEKGNGIENALVTISYKDGSGQRITTSVRTKGGNVAGVAAFDHVPEVFYAVLDIQAAGYRSVSVLDKELRTGEHDIYALSKASDNELYLRGVDLGGKDLVNEETKISLMTSETDELAFKVLVTKTGSQTFPSSIELYSDNRKKTVLEFISTDTYELDADTRVYYAKKKWIDRNAGLFSEDDRITVKYGSGSKSLIHLTVKNALMEPGVSECDLPLSKKEMPEETNNMSAAMGGSGWLDVTAQILAIPVTVGCYPDGGMIIMATYDLANLSPIGHSYSSLFKSSWNPKAYDSTEGLLNVFKKSFWENAERVKGGKAALDSKSKIKAMKNKNFNVSLNFSLFFSVKYNTDSKRYDGSGGLMLCGSFSGGVTEYFLIPLGPVVIPTYAGFDAGIRVNTLICANFDMGEGYFGPDLWNIDLHAMNGDLSSQGRLDLIISFSLFGGIGVKGALGADATGYATFDGAAVLNKKGLTAEDSKPPHYLVDAMFGVKFNYYFLFFSGSVSLDCLKTGPLHLYDSEKDSVLAGSAGEEPVFYDLDLEQCRNDLVPSNENISDEPGALIPYRLADEDGSLKGGPDYRILDADTYPDSQIQFVSTRQHTTLFRIISEGDRTSLIYQHQAGYDGKEFQDAFKIDMPGGKSVTEFMAVPSVFYADDDFYGNNVYIGAIIVDHNEKDPAARARTAQVAAITVNVRINTVIQCRIISPEDELGKYYYSTPRPIEGYNNCSVVYGRAPVSDTTNGLLSNIREETENISAYQDYRGNVFYYKLGSGTIFSNGTYGNNEPQCWFIDTVRSTDHTLVMNGWSVDGYYRADDPRCNFTVDISSLGLDGSDENFRYDLATAISNWQYMNSRCYFISGNDVYWLNRINVSGSMYSWEAKIVEGGAGLVRAEGSYQMITNRNISAIYLVGVIGNYSVNMADGTAEKTENLVTVHTIVTEDLSSGAVTKVHGPVRLDFAYGEPVTVFAASNNPEHFNDYGLSLAFIRPDETGTELTESGLLNQSSDLCVWDQNAARGLRVTNVTLPDPLVKKDKGLVEAFVTYRNYGYAKEGPVRFVIKDETGTVLREMVETGKDTYREIGADEGHWNADLYTGDIDTIKVFFRQNPAWQVDEEHEITIEVSYPYYEGDIGILDSTAQLKADNITLDAKNILFADKHYASISVTNNSLPGLKSPDIKVVPVYAADNSDSKLLFSMPADFLYSFDPEDEAYTDMTYHYSIDLDDFWNKGLGTGIIGAYVYLVDDEGNVISNEAVYLENPHEGRKKQNSRDQQKSGEDESDHGSSDTPAADPEPADPGTPAPQAPGRPAWNDPVPSASPATPDPVRQTVRAGNILITIICEDGSADGLTVRVEGKDFLKEYVTGKDGQIRILDIPVGEYTITQITADERHRLPDSAVITVKEGSTVTVTFKDLLKDDVQDIEKKPAARSWLKWVIPAAVGVPLIWWLLFLLLKKEEQK